MERFDAIVVGAGPAGSTTAYRLASAGARVLLLDRARFPRDKPCGGGLTGRAVRLLPFTVDPVVEERANRVELGLGYRRRFERASAQPLVVLTQRSRLDAFLAERASAAGADFRDGVSASDLAADDSGVRLRLEGRLVGAAALVGADGANGPVARAFRLGGGIVHGVALEGNLPYGAASRERFGGRLVLQFGVVPGGYSWIFPKGDHVNVGVGGWKAEGPRLRAHLERLCAAYDLPPERTESVRGWRLPMRTRTTRIAAGRVALVGDAAGLVDPFSGDGMYEAFLSSQFCSDAVLALLAGSSGTLEPYAERLNASLASLSSASWRLKYAHDRSPALAFTLVRTPVVWPVIEAVVRGDLASPSAARGVARGPLRLLRALGRRQASAPES